MSAFPAQRVQFAGCAPKNMLAVVRLTQREPEDTPTLKYTVHITSEMVYWARYAPESFEELREVWFDARVFPDKQTATAVYECLTHVGIEPTSVPQDRLPRSVPLDTVDLDLTLRTCRDAFGPLACTDVLESFSTTTSQLSEGLRRANLAEPLVTEFQSRTALAERNLARLQSRANAASRPFETRSTLTAANWDRGEIKHLYEMTETLYTAYLQAWVKTTAVFEFFWEIIENEDAGDWAYELRQQYRDQFDTEFENHGKALVDAFRQRPTLRAYLLQSD